MRSFPIFYITLALLCAIFIGAGLSGGASTDQSLPGGGAEATFFLSWVPICTLLLMALSLLLWIGALVHLLQNKALEGTDKIVWLLVVVLLNALGAILYFFLAPDPHRPRIAAQA